MHKPELLAPGGSLDRLIAAVDYGADAVYIGGEYFSLRTAAENFSPEEMRRGIDYAHAQGMKVYVAANILPHNADLAPLADYLREIDDLGTDAVILSDPGALLLAREVVPNLPVHISTQANALNYKTVELYRKLGARRVILARELSLHEVSEIREKCGDAPELEMFVHGAMCVSYSGRCLLSNYFTGRDANRGECAQPCRWKYYLMEEKRPGEYLPVFENERGTFLMNSKDLCLIEHLPELIRAGVCSFKIEGRVKTAYYVATVVKAYREAIDRFFADPEGYRFDPALLEELRKVSHRDYTEGFLFGRPAGGAQVYATGSYIREYDLVAVVEAYDETTGIATLSQRNKFSEGDEVEVIQPGKPFFAQIAQGMTDGEGNPITSTPHAEMTIKMKLAEPAVPGAMLRCRRKGEADEKK